MRYPVAAAGAAINTVSFRGNYNGAGGTYICTNAAGTPCIVTVSPAGLYAQAAGTWTFTPELNARAYQSDATFMSFGWWLRTPAGADGAYAFRYYADGTPVFAATATAPTGSATYNGRAAGRYVVQEVGAVGVTDGVSGEFTAAATLTANFDAMNTGGTPAPTIQGSISGFQGEMGGMSDWAVTLTVRIDAGLGWGRERPEAEQQRNSRRWVRLGATAALPWGFTLGGSGTLRWTDYEGEWFPFTTAGAERRDLTRSLRVFAHNRALTLEGFSPHVSVVQEQRTSNAQLHDYERISGELRFVRLF